MSDPPLPPRRTSDHPPHDPPGAGEGAREPAARDATAFTRAGAAGMASREMEGLYRLLVQSVTDYAIFLLDPEGRVASWNEGAERIKGYAVEEILGRPLTVFYPAEAVAKGFPAHALEVAAREGRFEDEEWRVRKDGTRFWANVVITALRDEAGELVGFAKVTRDLTARRAAEEQARRLAAEAAARAAAEQRSEELQRLGEQLQQQAMELELQTEEAQSLTEELQRANQELQQALDAAERFAAAAATANRAKAEFLTVMSHELRTPLNAIGGYAELLDMGVRGPVTAEQREDLARIRRSQQHLLAIINDILNFSRIEAGQVAYEYGPVPLDEVADAVTPLVGPPAAAKGLTLERGPCDPARVVALADRTKVEQILLNLLSNAVKFTPPGGRITVTCERRSDHVALLVADTGPGVPPDDREAIFEPFVQLGRSLTTGHEGTGLGLAISRDLARAMGGDLTLDGEAGAGATFALVLPAA